MSRYASKALQILVIALLACVPGTAGADDGLAEVRTLYAGAFYDRALTALERIGAQDSATLADQQTIRRYKALCLIALGRDEEAARVVNELVLAEPLASADPADPPRLRDLVRRVRLRVAPDVARERYARGRRHFLEKAYAEAAADFESVVALVDDRGLDLSLRSDFVDLRLIAQGFLELISSNVATDVAAPVADSTSPAQASPFPQQQGDAIPVIPPVVISQELPPMPDAMRLRWSGREGVIEVTVGTDGTVQAATIMAPTHPAYDVLLLSAAKSWKFRPASQGGVPVSYKKRIRVILSEH